MPEYLLVRSNGRIALPAQTRRKAKISEGDLLEAIVDANGVIRLVPKLALAEKYQLDDDTWALKQKDKRGWGASLFAILVRCYTLVNLRSLPELP